MLPPPPTSTLFPYTTLFRSSLESGKIGSGAAEHGGLDDWIEQQAEGPVGHGDFSCAIGPTGQAPRPGDRKSTRLNSSHQIISYAVFCLKKKNAKLALTQTDH